jgi:hypothetical protein
MGSELAAISAAKALVDRLPIAELHGGTSIFFRSNGWQGFIFLPGLGAKEWKVLSA